MFLHKEAHILNFDWSIYNRFGIYNDQREDVRMAYIRESGDIHFILQAIGGQ
jgi:hypothetical protein